MAAPNGLALFRVVSVVSAIFGIGVIAVSGALLSQAIRYREYYFYGNYGSGGYGSDYYGYGRGGTSGYYQGQYNTGYGYGSGGAAYAGVGYQDEYDPYRYHRVISIAAVSLGAGIIQFLVSFFLCCANGKSSKPLAIGYICGTIFLILVMVICFGLAFQYRVIYPYYFYNAYKSYQYVQYNSEGQAFCAILGIDLIYLIISIIAVGILTKRAVGYEDPVEWQVRPTTSSTAAANDYGHDQSGVRIS